MALIIPDEEQGTLGHVRRAPSRREPDYELGEDLRLRRVLRSWDPEGEGDIWRVRRRLQPEIMECYAGVIAERRVSRRHVWIGADLDLHRALDLLMYCVMAEGALKKLQDYLWAETEGLVEREWEAIEAVAAELLARRTLTGREVVAIMEPIATTLPAGRVSPV